MVLHERKRAPGFIRIFLTFEAADFLVTRLGWLLAHVRVGSWLIFEAGRGTASPCYGAPRGCAAWHKRAQGTDVAEKVVVSVVAELLVPARRCSSGALACRAMTLGVELVQTVVLDAIQGLSVAGCWKKGAHVVEEATIHVPVDVRRVCQSVQCAGSVFLYQSCGTRTSAACWRSPYISITPFPSYPSPPSALHASV